MGESLNFKHINGETYLVACPDCYLYGITTTYPVQWVKCHAHQPIGLTRDVHFDGVNGWINSKSGD